MAGYQIANALGGSGAGVHRSFHRAYLAAHHHGNVTAADELTRTPGGRPLRLDDVRQWGVFLVSDMAFDYFCLGPVVLVMQEERP